MRAPDASLLSKGDQLRRQGKWADAAIAYETAVRTLKPIPAAPALNLAICRFALGEFEQASRYANTIPATDGRHYWRARVIHARSQGALGKYNEALSTLRQCLAHDPKNGELALELADLLFHRVGDAAAARDTVAPFLDHPEHGPAASQTYIVASFYDRDQPASDLVSRIKQFAAGLAVKRKAPTFAKRPAHRMRVGLVSGYFSVSPAYFLSFGILAELAEKVDLVFIDRGSKRDWANVEFRRIAAEWIEVGGVSSFKVSESLHAAHLDVLFDMCGWSDIDVLRALTDKPCPKLFKWVGGQSGTSGLDVFDGYISDAVQTPAETQTLYTEPLINLKAGYVSYTPPAYLPATVPARTDLLLVGVVGNPVKVSRGFAAHVGQVLQAAAPIVGVPIALQFIDSRYAHALVRNRISELLRPTLGESKQVAVLFTPPKNHKDFLEHVAKLSVVVDTEPYSAGLTALEALAMGVPILGRAGELCCERHAESHWHFSGKARNLKAVSPASLSDIQAQAGKPRSSLISRTAPRSNHRKVATELLSHLSQATTYQR